MEGINEPAEPRKGIASENWAEFLREFAIRNNDRRARFDVFESDGTVEEEGAEAHLEDIVLKDEGNAKTIEIIRIDRADANAEKGTASSAHGLGHLPSRTSVMRVNLPADGARTAR